MTDCNFDCVHVDFTNISSKSLQFQERYISRKKLFLTFSVFYEMESKNIKFEKFFREKIREIFEKFEKKRIRKKYSRIYCSTYRH